MIAARSARTKKAVEDNNKTMGEGSDKIVKSMMYEMPLGSLVTYGVMSFEQLDGLIRSLNEG
jgi:beta-glucosidase